MSLNFALSLQYGPSNWQVFLNEYPWARFAALETTRQIFSEPEFGKYTEQAPGPERIHLTEVMAASLTRSIAEQTPPFMDEFRGRLKEVVAEAAVAGVEAMTLDFGLDSANSDGERHRRLVKFLKSLYPIFYRSGMKWCLPVRVPYLEPEIPAYFSRFLTEMMCPLCRWSVDIHPHELGKNFAPAEILRWLKFDLEIVRFIYEPELGNRLVAKSIGPWLDYLRQTAFGGLVVFAPKITNADFYLNETEQIAKLLQPQ